MATYNTSTKYSKRTVNKDGHVAYKLDAKTDLATKVLSSFMSEPKFYGDTTNDMIALATDVVKSDPEFIAKLAIFTRDTCNMRSTSHALICVLARYVKNAPYVRRTIKRIVVRGDDITNILATYKALFGNPIPNSLRRGLKDAIEASSFSTLAKYQSKNRSISMKDAICICHPTPADDSRRKLYGDIIAGKQATPTSWKTETQKFGNTADAWDSLMETGHLPYMAALRNIANIVKTGGDTHRLASILSDRKLVKESRQLPFRFLSAYKTMPEFTPTEIHNALNEAFVAACDNVPELGGRTLVAIDTSGSMSWYISQNSSVHTNQIAAALALCLRSVSDKCVFVSFDSNARFLPYHDSDKPLDWALNLRCPGGWTNMASVFELATDLDIDVDRIVILSDNVVNGSKDLIQRDLEKYRKHVGHDVWCHAWDLQGYGTTQFDGAKTNILAGWSDRGLSQIAMAERGTNALIADVESVSL